MQPARACPKNDARTHASERNWCRRAEHVVEGQGVAVVTGIESGIGRAATELFLASDGARRINGVLISVDGGWLTS